MLKFRGIRRRAFIENDQIHREALGAPILMRPQQLLDELHVVVIVNSHQNDRQIPGYSIRPQARGGRPVPGQNVARRAQRRIRIQHPIGDALKVLGLVEVDAEISQLHLRLGPGKRLGAFEHGCVTVLVGQCDGLLAARGQDGPEGDARRGARRHAHPSA